MDHEAARQPRVRNRGGHRRNNSWEERVEMGLYQQGQPQPVEQNPDVFQNATRRAYYTALDTISAQLPNNPDNYSEADFRRDDAALRRISNAVVLHHFVEMPGDTPAEPADPLAGDPAPQPNMTIDFSKLGLPTHLRNRLWEALQGVDGEFKHLDLGPNKGTFIVSLVGLGLADVIVGIPTVYLYNGAGETFADILGQQFNVTVPGGVTTTVELATKWMNVSLNALGTNMAILAFFQFLGLYIVHKLGNADERELLTDKERAWYLRLLDVVKEVTIVLALTIIPSAIMGWLLLKTRPPGTPVTDFIIALAFAAAITNVPQMVLAVNGMIQKEQPEHWNAITKDLETQLNIWINRFSYDRDGAMEALRNFFEKLRAPGEALTDKDILHAMQTLNKDVKDPDIVLYVQGAQLSRFGEFLRNWPFVNSIVNGTASTLSLAGVLAFTLYTATSTVDIVRYFGADSLLVDMIALMGSGGITWIIYKELYRKSVEGILGSLKSTQKTPGSLVPWTWPMTLTFAAPVTGTLLALASGPAGYDTMIKSGYWLASVLSGIIVTYQNINPFAKGVINSVGFGALAVTPTINGFFYNEFINEAKVFMARRLGFMTVDENLQIALRFIAALQSNITVLKSMPEANQKILLKFLFTPDAEGIYHPVTMHLFGLWKETVSLPGKLSLQKSGQHTFFSEKTVEGVVNQNPQALNPRKAVEPDHKKWPKADRCCPTYGPKYCRSLPELFWSFWGWARGSAIGYGRLREQPSVNTSASENKAATVTLMQ